MFLFFIQYRHFKSYPQKSKSYPLSYPHIHIIHKNRHNVIKCLLKFFKFTVDNHGKPWYYIDIPNGITILYCSWLKSTITSNFKKVTKSCWQSRKVVIQSKHVKSWTIVLTSLYHICPALDNNQIKSYLIVGGQSLLWNTSILSAW